MVQTAGPTKTELQDQTDEAIEILDEAYTPEASREELAAAVGKALDALRGVEAEEEEDGEDGGGEDYVED